MLTDGELAKSLGGRAASKVRSQFGWDKVAAVFAEACERAAKPSGREVLKDEIITVGSEG